MNVRASIEKRIAEALARLGVEDPKVVLELTADLAHGDYATSAALVYAKEFSMAPRALAEKLVEMMGQIDGVSKIDIAGPGFINFSIDQSQVVKTLQGAVGNSNWGANSDYSGKKYLVEHSSPNLFKPFHVGHLVNNTLGESIARLVKFAGAETTTMTFPSDVSPGIAKAVWGLMDKGWGEAPTMQQIADAYVWGTQQYDESESAKARIDEINSNIYNEVESKEYSIYQLGRDLTLKRFLTDTKNLGSTFDDTVFESEAEKTGKKIVHAHTPGVFEESNGAIIYRGSNDGLYDDVFINSAGFGTYLAKDIGLLDIKFRKYDPDCSITITDYEQERHFMLVKAAARHINQKWADNSLAVHHGRLRFPEGKISSRLGNVPLAMDVMNEISEEIVRRMSGRVQENEKGDISQQIMIGAIKFAILRAGRTQNLVFDPEQAVSLEGDSGPYLQYAHARAFSLADKAATAGVDDRVLDDSELNEFANALSVGRIASRFPDIVARASQDLEPHHVANYLVKLSSEFNSWYANTRLIGGSYPSHALLLTKAVQQTLKNGLWLLGIPAPEKM